jgi:hypothetical protein
MVSIRIRHAVGRHKLVPRDARHGLEHALITDAAVTKLQRDHGLAAQGESIGLGTVAHVCPFERVEEFLPGEPTL